MKTPEELKKLVQEKYSEIAMQSKDQNQASCCGSGCCSDEVYNIMSDDYAKLSGYNPDADLGLGCGLPTEFARIKKGDSVVDLGSGAGNDCFVARALAGEEGKVTGIDFSGAMIEKARANAAKLNYKNVEFLSGDIENIPLPGEKADVVVSNCVLNLVPDKEKAFGEIFRILKPGGHFSVSDIVLTVELPEKLKKAGEMYAGCVSGAMQKEEYLDIIRKTGFKNITVQKEKAIIIPDDILSNYLSPEEAGVYKKSPAGIFSVTVYAEKPSPCCSPECCG